MKTLVILVLVLAPTICPAISFTAESPNMVYGSKSNFDTNIVSDCDTLSQMVRLIQKINGIENKEWGDEFRNTRLPSFIEESCCSEVRKLNACLVKHKLTVDTININKVYYTFHESVTRSLRNYGIEDLIRLKLIAFSYRRTNKYIGDAWCVNKTPLNLVVTIHHKHYDVESVGAREHMQRTMESENLIAYGMVYTEGQTWTYTDKTDTTTSFTTRSFCTATAMFRIVSYR